MLRLLTSLLAFLAFSAPAGADDACAFAEALFAAHQDARARAYRAVEELEDWSTYRACVVLPTPLPDDIVAHVAAEVRASLRSDPARTESFEDVEAALERHLIRLYGGLVRHILGRPYDRELPMPTALRRHLATHPGTMASGRYAKGNTVGAYLLIVHPDRRAAILLAAGYTS